MPISEERVRHLLRRTEFVDRQARVDQLTGLASIEAAVDNVMAISAPSALSLGSGSDWERGQNFVRAWLDQMAGTSRPFRERMAFFWHGHIPSELGKVNSAPFMAEQIELWRSDGVNGNVGQLLKDMSLQVAMLRYLDNDRNFAESPNQNFARELMELFVLGVGNYVEADVEASTAAWTGHTAHWETGAYSFVVERHEYQAQTFLGRVINQNTKPFKDAGFQTIDVMLGLGDYAGGGTVPVGANLNRSTRSVAAEFLSKKLWQEFGEANTGTVPDGVLGDMVDALLDNDFDIRPWVRAMLVHDDFYPDTNPAVEGGLVRQPVEYMVALMEATGRNSSQVASLWLMDQAGQVLLYPPNVSGWKPNGYWVNASAFEARNRIALGCIWEIFDDYWSETIPWEERYKNFIQINGTKIYQDQIVGASLDSDDDPYNPPAPWHPFLTNEQLVDRLLDAMDVHYSNDTRQSLINFCASHWTDSPGSSANPPGSGNQYERRDVVLLALLAPEMHIN
ncbi:DUF1800 family protein [Ilumatobacter coccineus]|uniref:DUF1800 domain-containing protein n=1 Tax=Ilumatobacter coccineus (strain NBRC 103263 / KCTC 29153 / YM16-304) TaxID=1313172 RepID=A0A6C7E2S5_ILUCY|nr:DUF1800 family protein [Ilumatobacter coccineus]BAN01357.1 hypothetical protein YM304_10430 [Ilumatobacter coccineus YM16-304]